MYRQRVNKTSPTACRGVRKPRAPTHSNDLRSPGQLLNVAVERHSVKNLHHGKNTSKD